MSNLCERLNDAICNNPDILWTALDLEGEIYNERVSLSCLIHGGEKIDALNVYFNEYHNVRGRWFCATAGCHNTFKNSLIGLCRGILSSRHMGWSRPGDPIYPWGKTLKYLEGLYGISGNHKIDPGEVEKNQFIHSCAGGYNPVKEKKYICTLDKYLQCYTSPSQYFRERGFSYEVLEKYYVRHCDRSNSKFYNRSIVPQLDESNRFVTGISCRTTCNQEPKWLNSGNFPSSTSLYNYNNACESIRRNRTAIIVESPGCVWRLSEAGIYNAVGIWGAGGWNDYKQYLLDKLGVMRLILALDNDDAGRSGAAKIAQSTERFYNTVEVKLPSEFNDVADMDVETTKNLFKGA